MTDYVIPCETVARLSTIIARAPVDGFQCFRTLRIEGDLAIASDHKIMAVERITGGPGTIHVTLSDALIAACASEAAYASSLTITVVEALNYATAKTTYGYVEPSNCLAVFDVVPKFDSWRAIAMRAATPADKPNGGMMWYGDSVAALIAASPSGRVVFEQTIDINRPVLIRDPVDPNWFGLFNPYSADHDDPPATFPQWMLK